jgi:hypothetical protein
VSTSNDQVLSLGQEASRTVNPAQFPLELPVQAVGGEARLTLDLALFYCKSKNGGLCLFKEVRLILPVKVVPNASTRGLEVVYRVAAP